MTPQKALAEFFGFSSFRDGQEAVVKRALAGQHTLLVMPTGAGKSLAYQLPALLKPGLGLVISPLIALMKDQVDGLVERGLAATYINSSLSNPEVERRTRAVLEGAIKLLYVAPERLRSRRFTQALARVKVSLLAVDEAHCVSQWGHDFRPDYLQIGPTWEAMSRPTLIATTATATPTVQRDILTSLGVSSAQTIVTGFNRPNLSLRVEYTPTARAKLATLNGLLKDYDDQSGSLIVYAATRRHTEEVAAFIRQTTGRPAKAYHGGLGREARQQVQDDFMADRLKIVVATNAFGMGVNKADVRAVIHYNLPANLEAYYQEAGRAGRDGLPARCLLLFDPGDRRLQEWFINGDTPTYDDLRRVYGLLSSAASGGEVHLLEQELRVSAGLHLIKLRVALSELERAGVIFHMGTQAMYSSWKILPLSEPALQERAAAIRTRTQTRHRLLDEMVNYAQATSCRREILLRYFGDQGKADAPDCCDNHTVSNPVALVKAVTPQDWFPLIVLEAVRRLGKRSVGRNRLAQILTGSRAAAILNQRYDQHPFYGKLAKFGRKQITDLIDAILQQRYLALTPGVRPVLQLTDQGRQALRERLAVPVSMPALIVEQPKLAQPGGTTRVTQALFAQGLSLAEIAAKRELKVSTIYTHLAQLIVEGSIALEHIVPATIERQIIKAIVAAQPETRLAPIKALLPETISYGELRCVLAAHPELMAGQSEDQAGEIPGVRG